MKLYNIYKSIILEEAEFERDTRTKRDAILAAIEGKYNVRFLYKDDDNTTTERYVQIYDLGMSKAGNEMISAYQLGGKTKPTKENNKPYGWKQFRLDKIVDGSIEKTEMKYYKPVSDLPSYGPGPKFNKTGNKNMRGQITKVNFNKK